MSIIGDLKILNIIEDPKVIPKGLKVNGYIQFGKFQHKDIGQGDFDVCMKL